MAEPQGPRPPAPRLGRLADWHRQHSFFQPRRSSFWLFLALLLGSFVYTLYEQGLFASAYPTAWLLSLLLMAGVALPVLLIIYRLDRFEPEPPSMVVAAFLWGAVIAIFFASIANELLVGYLEKVVSPSTLESWGPALVAPVNEEFYKGMGLLVIYLIAPREFNSLMDGVVYGAFIGLGFQAVENVQYFVQAVDLAGGQDQIGPVLGTFFIRVIAAGLYSHVLFTGLVGVGFAYAVTRDWRPWWLRLGVLVALTGLAWLAHFVWNSPLLDSVLVEGGLAAFMGYAVVKGLPFFAFLAVLVVVARRQEAQAFSWLVATEVGSDVLSERELVILRSGRLRRGARRAVARAKGPVAGRLLDRLQREQIRLGLLSGSASWADPALEQQRQEIRVLRGRLAQIPVRR